MRGRLNRLGKTERQIINLLNLIKKPSDEFVELLYQKLNVKLKEVSK